MLPFDLHVLGLPPAFTLSQDQTLHLSIAARTEVLANALSAVALSKAQTDSLLAFACFLDSFGLCVKRLRMDNATGQTPAQVTCAHCQRSWTSASAPRPAPRTKVPEGAAHLTANFAVVNTL